MYTELKLDVLMEYSEDLDKHINTEYDIFFWSRDVLYWWSAYFDNRETPKYSKEWELWRLKSKWNIKNYESEIEKFLKRIEKYVVSWEWHIWHEEYSKPQCILKISKWKIEEEYTMEEKAF